MKGDFSFNVGDARIRVRFVGREDLGKLDSGHDVAGDYGENLIRLPRWELSRAQRIYFFHELGHYLIERNEIPVGKRSEVCTTDETICDLFTWLPFILEDARNESLRNFLSRKEPLT